jgi:outer membrane receptor for ferrienterochelin and colicins
LKILSCCLLSIIAGHSIVFAQEISENNAATVTYNKDYFERFSPVTLLDMLQRIPGVPEILERNRRQNTGGGQTVQADRGFGSGGDQILIGGKRLAGKANSIDDNLSRISAAQVSRIELIRGAASGLDVQSQGLVINIILLEGGTTSTTFWKVTGNYLVGRKFAPEFLLSQSGTIGGLEYMLSAERKNELVYFDRDELIYDAANQLTGDKEVRVERQNKGYVFNSNLAYNFSDSSQLRLNGFFEPTNAENQEIHIETGMAADHTIWDRTDDNDKWEIGGDYTHDFIGLGRFKALFVLNNSKEDRFIDRHREIDPAGYQYATELTNLDKSEKIFRGSMTYSLGQKQSLEWGGEAAINNFDKTFNDYRAASAADALVLSTSDDVRIKENRYEVFANHTYNIAPTLVLQSSLTTEFSKIIADNYFANGTVERRDTNFTYYKPRLNLRYDHTERDQVRLTIEKKVSQLDFNNFVTSFDQRTNQFEPGNTNIRPEQVWEFSIAYEHRFAGDNGSIDGEVFYHTYKDYIAKVDFSEYVDFMGNPISSEAFFALPPTVALRDEVNFSSKSGNIDKASAKGVKLNANLRLGALNIPQAIVSIGYVYEKKRVIDQFTGLSRKFDRASDHSFTFNFRHDVTELKLSYGFEARMRSEHAAYERNYYWPWKPGTHLSAFAEYEVLPGHKARIEVAQENRATGRSVLDNYRDHIRFNELIRRAEKFHKTPVKVLVYIQGSF